MPRPAQARPPARPKERPALGWLPLAAELYARASRTRLPLDAEVHEVLRKRRPAGDDIARALELAYAMLRRRGLYERALQKLPFAPRREAAVVLHLCALGGANDLPVAAGERRALEAALAEAREELARAPLDEALAHATPVPAFVVRRLCEALGEEDARAICEALAEAPPIALRANTLKASREAVRQALLAEGVEVRPAPRSPEGLFARERTPLTRTKAFEAGLFERQDEGSQLLTLLCEARPGQTVVDACAGAGGKTLHLAARMENKGSLHALDIHARRLKELKRRVRRAGAHNVRTQLIDEACERPLASLEGRADAVLVDAPCSGTGTLRRAPDIGWRLEEGALLRLCETQAALLPRFARLVRPGGRLVYATCSVLEEEGAAQVRAFLAARPDFTPMPASGVLARQGVPALATDDGELLRLRPDRHGTDGFFGAVLVRRG